MLFHDSKDESAWGLALVGLIVVSAAAILGTVTGRVQPTAPYEREPTDVSAPYPKGVVVAPSPDSGNASPYAQPKDK